MQSQQPWIMAHMPASPLVQVTTHPSLVISHLHMAMAMLHEHTTIPFIMQQHPHMPPASMVHRFCIIVRAAASSVVQVIFMPVGIFSITILHRGTIIMFGAIAGIGAAPIDGVPIPGMPMPPIPVRSIIIVFVMIPTP
jgi:hypothetical protein